MHIERRGFALLLLFVAVPLLGAESGMAVRLERDGAAVEGGEICRSRAGDRENPFHRWLISQELTCAPAGQAMQFPSGLWNVFGRAGDAITSPVVVHSGTPQPSLSLQLKPAATLIPSLTAGQKGIVYAPGRAVAYPYFRSAERVLVPAGEELWLLVVEPSRVIAAIIPIPAIPAGDVRPIDARSGALPMSLLGWVQVPESDRGAVAKVEGIAAPRVSLLATTGRGADLLPQLSALNGAFVLVRDVAQGSAELKLEGRGWLPHARQVTVGKDPVTIVEAPLEARGAAAVIVSWGAVNDLPALDRYLGSCDPERDAGRQIELSLAACPASRKPDEPLDPSTCKIIHQEAYGPELPHGSFVLEDLVPGTFRAEMRFGKLPPISQIVSAPVLQRTRVRLSADYDTLEGALTLGGEPLSSDATLHFPDGGLGFSPADSGAYKAVLVNIRSLMEEDRKIDITTCDERLRVFVLTDRPARRYGSFDFDIPDNALVVNVLDTFTRLSLPSATLRYTVMSSLVPKRPLVTRLLKEGEGEGGRREGDVQGQFVLKAVPEREIRLMVNHPGYQKSGVEPFTMARSGTKVVDVLLMPLRGSAGKLLSSRPFESAAIVWLSPSGIETERADVDPDGSFIYENSHEPGEIVAVASLSHPLWVSRMPLVARAQELQLHFPDAPSRAFTVSLEGRDRRAGTYIGITVGGLLIPQSAFRLHQNLRELPSLVFTNHTMPTTDIAETGPIDLLLGPTVNDIPSRGRTLDPLLLPQAADAPRQRLLPGMSEVMFNVE